MSAQVVEKLTATLADTYKTSLKTQYYHWNVTGIAFYALHEMFEEQYKELSASVDEIAERIRALGAIAPASFKTYSEYSKIEDEPVNGDAMSMIKGLIKDHEQILASLKALQNTADEAGDSGSEDFAVAKTQEHEKTLWMLKASISS